MSTSINALAAIGAAAVLTVSIVTATTTDRHFAADDRAAAAAPLVRYDGKTPVALDLDAHRIAVYIDGDRNGAEAMAKLRPRGLAGERFEPLAAPGWTLADVPKGIADAGAVRALIADASAVAGVDFVAPVFFDGAGRPAVPTPVILVRFTPATTVNRARAVLDAAGAAILSEHWAGMTNAYKVTAPGDGFAVLAAANALAVRDDVVWAEVDWLLQASLEHIPNDPLFPGSWHLRNTGQAVNASCLGWTAPPAVPDMDMDVAEAWDLTIGSPDVLVAVFDTGVDQTHPDINQVGGYDTTAEGPGNGGPLTANDGHGTFVAGTISSIIDNSTGAAGVAPGVRVVSIRVLIGELNGTGAAITPSAVVEGLEICEQIGVRVTNHSYTLGSTSSAVANKFLATSAKMVHFASSGNGGGDSNGDPAVAYPSSLDSVKSIAALDPDGTLTGFSNYGDRLFLAAPGIGVASAVMGGGSTCCFCGTSAASPCAAGVAALVISAKPSLTPGQVSFALRVSAVDLGAPGFDPLYGWGFVNANNAVRFVFEAACGTGQGDCLLPHAMPGCALEDCCIQVCVENPFCCEVAWDTLCVDAVIELCQGCPSTGDCFEVNASPGCDDESCCSAVCAADPLCCDAEFGWDAPCVSLAMQLCGGQGCGSGGSCFETHPEPGCADLECCAMVCELDPQCCGPVIGWDSACVAHAMSLCGADPPNDDCDDASPFTHDIVAFSTVAATPDGPPHVVPCNLNAAFNSDVWFDFVPQCTGSVTLTASSGSQMYLALYEGCECPITAQQVIECRLGGGFVQISALVEGGVCYKVRLATPNASPTSGTISAQCHVFYDECDSASVIDDYEGNLSFTTYGADSDGPSHSTCGIFSDHIYHDIWFDWQAPCDGNLIVSTCGTAEFDTRIAIYDGIDCPVTGARLLDCFDDHPTCPGDTTLASAPVELGQWYKVRLGSNSLQQQPGSAGGTVRFECEPGPANDDCANAALTFLGVPTPFDNTDATTDGPVHDHCHPGGGAIVQDLWFARTATCTGELTISACEANFWTKLAVYEGVECPVTEERLLECSAFNGTCGVDFRADVTVDVVAGEPYLVRVGNAAGAPGQGELVFDCVPYDCPGNVNGDAAVDVDDLIEVILGWGTCAPPLCPPCPGDVTGDCVVNVDDLVQVVVGWGPCG